MGRSLPLQKIFIVGNIGKTMSSCPLIGKIRIKQKRIYSNSSKEKTKRKKFIVTADVISRHCVNTKFQHKLSTTQYCILI